MFSVAVIKLRDLVKITIFMILIIVVIFFLKNNVLNKEFNKLNITEKISNNSNIYIKKAIDVEVPEIKQIVEEKEELLIDENMEDADKEFKTKLMDTIFKLELGAFNITEETEKNSIGEIEKEIQKNEENETKRQNSQEGQNEKEKEKEEGEEVNFAEDNIKTKVITKNPIADNYTLKIKGVKIKNETSYDLTEEDLDIDNLKIDKSNIIIFHTHTCESYTPSKIYDYIPTGNFRTTNLKYTVAKVGDELTKYLKKYKFNVNHDKTYHDYPAYTGSYSRSLVTVSNILKNTKADIIIDLHRDAIGKNSSYAPTVKIGEDECAQLMFVMGSDGGGLKHPNWKQNLKFAIGLQKKANEKYPGLFKTIILRNSRYNQHLGKAACIIEVGATGNTLEQCLKSMKYLSKIINEF